MWILSKKRRTNIKAALIQAYIRNIQEEKEIEDCVDMNRLLSSIAVNALGKEAADIPDLATEQMRRSWKREKEKQAKYDYIGTA